ncbi:prolipoprotein diacylglyceryl transferase [Lacrimispora sp. JR3]|uniref:prolipoprotein diacylglyceryl transferase n=1 Tax=Lacrimispora sinapis TaxID=3111456 RepID=UPI003749E577
MYNDLFSIGNITFHGYGLMIGIGILAAYLTAENRVKKSGLDSEHVFPLLLWGCGFGLVSAKLLYFITIFEDIKKDPSLLLNLSGGFVVYGGIFGGVAAGYVYCRIKKIGFFTYLDQIVPSISLAQGFGRLGCLLAGCCYGTPYKGPFSIVFHTSQFAPNEVSLFPSQVISSGYDFLLFLILSVIAGKNRTQGKVTAFYLIFYSIGRFLIEFYRGDLIRGSVGVLSTSQFISLFAAAAGFFLLWKTRNRINKNK